MQGCRLFKRCRNLPARHCVAGVQADEAVSELSSHALWGRGAGYLNGVRTYLPGTVLQGCRLLKWYWNLPPGHCVACCRLFKWCQNLPAGHCVAGMQAVKEVMEPSSPALWGRGAGCLRDVGTYLPCTVGQGCRLFRRCRNLPPWHCVACCRLFKWCPNLPARHCVAGVQAVKVMSEPSSRALWGRGAGCLRGVGTNLPCLVGQGAGSLIGVGTYLLGIVGQGFMLFKRCLFLGGTG